MQCWRHAMHAAWMPSGCVPASPALPHALPLQHHTCRGRHVRIGGRGWSDSDDRTVSPSPRHPDGASPGRAARSPRFSDQYYDDLHEHGDDDDDEGEGEKEETVVVG